MRDRDPLYAVKIVNVSFGVEPVYNAITTLEDLALCDCCLGMGEWLYQTADALPAAIMHQHKLIFGALHCLFNEIISAENCANFPAFIEAFAAFDPLTLRDAMIEQLRHFPEEWAEAGAKVGSPPSASQLLGDV